MKALRAELELLRLRHEKGAAEATTAKYPRALITYQEGRRDAYEMAIALIDAALAARKPRRRLSKL